MSVRLSCLVAVCLSLAFPVAAQDTSGDAMTPRQFFDLGVTMLREGQPQDAANVADALLMRAPSDASALILRAEAAIELGDFTNAVTFARTAYTVAALKNQKFAAARLAALAQSQLQNDTRAQIWLRRARQYAPDALAARTVAKDYQFLRRRNPWSTQLRFGITPSSNINNGSANATSPLFSPFLVFGLDRNARSLSGFAFSGGVQTSYRLRETQTALTRATFEIDAQTYALSNTSRFELRDEYDASVALCRAISDVALQETCLAGVTPVSTGSDFSDATLSFGINHRQILTEGAQPTDFDVKFGKSWYGSAASTYFVDASISHAWQIDDKNRISAMIRGQRRSSYAGSPDIDTTEMSARWNRTRTNKDRFELGISLRESRSDTPDANYSSVIYSAGYDFSKPVYGLRFGIDANFEQRDIDFSRFAGGPREDRTLGLNMSVAWDGVEFYGLRPVLNIDLRRNESTLDFFDRDYRSVGLNLKSSF
tara:strand:+ start:925 stop:2376 length:1452 start_codon:yes stop_codon:yes gene_type:complete